MKIILQQDVRDLGKKGQTVEVAEGYARNYLLPRKLAIPATADNMNVIRQKEQAKKLQQERERAEALEIAKKLESCLVKIPARAGSSGRLFGAVTSQEIADALGQQCGIAIPKNKIVQEEPIKQFGSYQVKCRLGHEVGGTIYLIVTEA